MKRKRSNFYISQEQQSFLNHRNMKSTIENNQPKCTICLQGYTNRTFVRHCYHSFCFSCIKQWINVVPECPLCKRTIISLVYNVVEETNTFTEYYLNSASSKKHNPPSLPSLPPLHTQRQTLTTRWRHKRKLLYQQVPYSKVIFYPPPLSRFHSFSVIQPDHISKIIPFIQNEIYILIGNAYDSFIEEHIKNILLIPYYNNIKGNNNNNNLNNNNNEMTMYDDSIILQLAELIDENEQVMKRWMDELLAYLKSGLTYMTFINTAEYEYQDEEEEEEEEEEEDDDDDNNEDNNTNNNNNDKKDGEEEGREGSQQEIIMIDDDDDDDPRINLSPSVSYISTSSSAPSTSNL